MTALNVPAAPRVAYQGEPGAYGEMAIVQHWRGIANAIAATSFPETLALLGRGIVEYAVIPVWNSTIGEIAETRVLLDYHAARIDTVAELTVPIAHCLMALPGASLTSIRFVGSHPAALAQCRRLFATRPEVQPCVAHDTAGAARELAMLAGGRTPNVARAGALPWYEPYRPVPTTALAVIAGASVARLYGLIVLAAAVQDEPANATRFVVVSARDGARW